MKALLICLALSAGCAAPRRVALHADGSLTLNDRPASLGEIGGQVTGSDRRPRVEIHPDTAWRLVQPLLAACLDAGADGILLDGLRVGLHRKLEGELLVLEVEIRSGPRYKLGTLRTGSLGELESWLAEQQYRSRYYAHPAVGSVRAQGGTPFEVVREVLLAIRAAGVEWISLGVD